MNSIEQEIIQSLTLKLSKRLTELKRNFINLHFPEQNEDYSDEIQKTEECEYICELLSNLTK